MDGRPEDPHVQGRVGVRKLALPRHANAAYQKLRSRQGESARSRWDDVLPVLDKEGGTASSTDDWSARVDGTGAPGRAARAVLDDAIDGLPGDYRTALVLLHDVEGLSNPDIADTLGISLPAVQSRVHRSRLFVRSGSPTTSRAGERP